MNQLPTVRICPLETFRLLPEADLPPKAAALLSSSHPLQTASLPPIAYAFEKYDDVEQPIFGRALTERQAERFARFLERLPRDVEMIYCCCDSGMSRSAAVAAVVCRFYHLDDRWIWNSPHYHPNTLVFRMLSEALDMPVPESELERLVQCNRQAYLK